MEKLKELFWCSVDNKKMKVIMVFTRYTAVQLHIFIQTYIFLIHKS